MPFVVQFAMLKNSPSSASGRTFWPSSGDPRCPPPPYIATLPVILNSAIFSRTSFMSGTFDVSSTATSGFALRTLRTIDVASDSGGV